MASDKRLLRIVVIAILAALSTVLGIFVRVPSPVGGYFTLLDAGIFTAAMLFGNRAGLAVGAIGGFLNDFLTGYPQWMFFSLVIHGAQGLTGNVTRVKALNYLISGLVMVGGYFIGDIIVNGSLGAAFANLLGNFVQNTAGFLIALVISQILERSKVLDGLR